MYSSKIEKMIYSWKQVYNWGNTYNAIQICKRMIFSNIAKQLNHLMESNNAL